MGIKPLRERIAQHYTEAYSVDLDWHQVLITTGSSAAFSLAFLACFDVGDRVAIARPGYPAYGRIMRALGLVPVEIKTTLANNFQPTAAQIEALENVQGLLVASPSNPTGTVIDAPRLKALAEVCTARGIRFISDEIYHRIGYGEGDSTALSYSADAVIINSFSKYYCMTGWRIGWMVVPEDLARPIERLSQNMFISPPTMSQHAALVSFDCTDELDARVAQYQRNRDMLVKELGAAGMVFPSVDGAFYLYADVSKFTNDSSAFCKDMLESVGVASVPGIDFDEQDGHRYLRMCFAGSYDDMTEAASRLSDWLPGQVLV